ncbi:hypothetical protein [Roseisolibacter sp. H3M3-2]|uniref:hypothetical protein n=1 Tax=Roseisolibacter sp. H3M3-2 TaxID=3031323 RepID=UPI0023DA62A2|nr:hypothetical protein [Roseisolibacter sp. H3M3-2]MDF1502101.1 hypothetical protein [Roseisolibacter sp. H3M3-2]
MTTAADTQPASALNREAGDHAVTRDPTEIAAAERAIRRSWGEFPYYARRYGARGRAFSSSDSGWLITLCDLPPAGAEQQVLWLGTVLSARGMPRWLLEVHLDQLHDELSRARPGLDGARYARLHECAAALRERRLARLDAETHARVEREFDARVSEDDRRLHRRTGGILAAAVADERDGIALAVTSVVGWLTDPARFGDRWVAAVHEAVADARASAR